MHKRTLDSSSMVFFPLDMALKFYTSMTQVLKLKVRKFLGINPTFVEVTGEKLVGGPLWAPRPEYG